MALVELMREEEEEIVPADYEVVLVQSWRCHDEELDCRRVMGFRGCFMKVGGGGVERELVGSNYILTKS